MRGPNYELLPAHMRGAMRRWIERGIWPGDFLTAVLQNNLVEAAVRADETNLYRLFDYSIFLYNEIPSLSWGSTERTEEWARSRQSEPIDAAGNMEPPTDLGP